MVILYFVEYQTSRSPPMKKVRLK